MVNTQSGLAQGTFLQPSVGQDLAAMARHQELLGTAAGVKARMAQLKLARQPDGGDAARALRRSASISAAERHMLNFDRLVQVWRACGRHLALDHFIDSTCQQDSARCAAYRSHGVCLQCSPWELPW